MCFNSTVVVRASFQAAFSVLYIIKFKDPVLNSIRSQYIIEMVNSLMPRNVSNVLLDHLEEKG